MILTTYSDDSDVLVFTTESDHYCIIVRALKNIKLNEDGTLDSTPIHRAFHNEAFACEDREQLHTRLLNIEAAGYRVPWGQLLNRIMGPNVEFSGGAPLHGAASAGTQG